MARAFGSRSRSRAIRLRFGKFGWTVPIFTPFSRTSTAYLRSVAEFGARMAATTCFSETFPGACLSGTFLATETIFGHSGNLGDSSTDFRRRRSNLQRVPCLWVPRSPVLMAGGFSRKGCCAAVNWSVMRVGHDSSRPFFRESLQENWIFQETASGLLTCLTPNVPFGAVVL